MEPNEVVKIIALFFGLLICGYSHFKLLHHLVGASLANLLFWLSGLVTVSILLMFQSTWPLFSSITETLVLLRTVFLALWWICLYLSANASLTWLTTSSQTPTGKFVHTKIFRDLISLLLFILTAAAIVKFVLQKDVSGIFTASGVMAIIIGYSAQSTLGDVFAGLGLNAARQFKTGDCIRCDDKDSISGEVVEINWRFVKLLTADKIVLSIPNSVVAKMAILNRFQLNSVSKRQLDVPVRASLSPEVAAKILISAATQTEHVMANPPPTAGLKSFPGTIGAYHIYSISYYASNAMAGEVTKHINANIWYQCRRYGQQLVKSDISEVSLPDQSLLEVFLAQSDLFNSLSREEISQLARKAICHPYGPPERVLTQGDHNTSLFLIYSGQVDIYLGVNTEPAVKVATLNAGQYFGEMSMLVGDPCGATVQVATESVIIEINHDNIASVFDANPLLMEKLSEVIVARKAQNEGTISALTKNHAASDSPLARMLNAVRNFFGHKN